MRCRRSRVEAACDTQRSRRLVDGVNPHLLVAEPNDVVDSKRRRPFHNNGGYTRVDRIAEITTR